MALRVAVVGFRHGHVTSIIKAIEEMDGADNGGRRLTVNEARPREDRSRRYDR